MMRVRHCSVRAIVDQPWRFGDRDALARAVTRLAVEVLAARLATQLQRVGQTAGLGRVALHVTLPASVVMDLAAPAATGPEGARLQSFAAELAVHDAAGRAVRQALERVVFVPAGPAGSDGRVTAGTGPGGPARPRPGARPGIPGPGTAAPDPETDAAVAAETRRRLTAAAVARTLLRALESGQLGPLLRRAGSAVAAEWARALAAVSATSPALPGGHGADPPGPGGGAPAGPPAAGGPPAVPRVAGDGPAPAAPAPAGPPSGDAGDAAPAGARVAEAVDAALAELGPAAEVEATRLAAAARAAERLGLLPWDPPLWRALERRLGPVPGPPPAPAGQAAPVPDPAPAVPPAGRPRRPGPVRREVEVASVLPFLLVGPLDELGVLDAVTAALAGTGSSGLQTAFAACLARKVLPAPAHGWFQPDEVVATVAAFSGGEHPPDGSATERLGGAATAWWPLVEAAVTETRVRLHAPEAPLVLARSASGLALADTDGYLPLLWDGGEAAAAGIWARCGRPPLLAGAAMAADPPGDLPVEENEALAAPLAELVALAGERPAAGRPGLAPELDGPMAELAGVGLAVVAWELWRRHEDTTHPAMAVGRLGDLDGRVRLERDRVEVRVPLGRRHADLRDSGLLRTVPEVAWLDGRRLEFTGG
jgi:hypothetical protein